MKSSTLNDMHSDERGFSYIDVLIGMMILLVGVMALSSALTVAVVRATDGEKQLRAKQLAVSTLESIFSARDVQVVGFGWTSIGNKNSANVPNGIFSTGRRQVTERAGADGIAGTSDDAEVTAANNNTGAIIPNFEREIVITDVVDPDRPEPIMMRRITVNIYYRSGSIWRSESVSTIITNSLFDGSL